MSLKELTVISGKGGTGKTSLVASFAALANKAVLADCDVDAADLHLILKPEVIEEHEFEGGSTAIVDSGLCTQCGVCIDLCRFDAIDEAIFINPLSCEGCGVCADHCPEDAIRMEREIAGKWFVSSTRFGPMVHAKLGIAQENSGKLVAQVRKRAKEIAEERNLDMIVVDGSPGIGCPVISSVTGADLVLVVTEPTQSGRHDLVRVLELARHFHLKTMVCVNKYDLNEGIARDIEEECQKEGAGFAGTIPYDPAMTQAMVAEKSLIEASNGPGAMAVQDVWKKVVMVMEEVGAR